MVLVMEVVVVNTIRVAQKHVSAWLVALLYHLSVAGIYDINGRGCIGCSGGS